MFQIGTHGPDSFVNGCLIPFGVLPQMVEYILPSTNFQSAMVLASVDDCTYFQKAPWSDDTARITSRYLTTQERITGLGSW